MTKRIGVMGGMFDPIHNGHLQVASMALQLLNLDHIRFVPCHIPNHRERAISSPQQRLAMLKLATAQLEKFVIDDRELKHNGVSYSVTTLSSLREEFPSEQLVFIMGIDAFNSLPGWHRWKTLLSLCHLLVVNRPGFVLDTASEIANVLVENRVWNAQDLFKNKCGAVFLLDTLAIELSSSQVRERIHSGLPLSGLLPGQVEKYMREHNLYTATH